MTDEAKFQHKPEITLTTSRCYKCGRYYAVEQYPRSSCPYCADAAGVVREDERQAQERVIRALRGAITRMRKRR